MDLRDEGQGQAHEPVLLKEVVEWLRPQQGGTYVDCTLGLGGHTKALLARSPEAAVIGVDRDEQALELAEERLKNFGERFRAVHGNFRDVAAILGSLNIAAVEGVLADLGVSSLQFDRAERGFSFAADAPLDMRMDRSEGETAAELVNRLRESELADLIFELGEERGARKVARAIVRQRDRGPIETTLQLADIVIRALNIPGRWRIHPATKTFQALRIAVNGELEALEGFIPDAITALAPGGRLAIISFHSLEDRIVKRRFQLESGRCLCSAGIIQGRAGKGSARQRHPAPRAMAAGSSADLVCSHCGARARARLLTRKPVRAGQEEIERNPRSRSALLRVCERL